MEEERQKSGTEKIGMEEGEWNGEKERKLKASKYPVQSIWLHRLCSMYYTGNIYMRLEVHTESGQPV